MKLYIYIWYPHRNLVYPSFQLLISPQKPELKEQTEEIKYGTVPMLQRCIKVFTDKLGKKIVPYWVFPNGCRNKEIAEKLDLIYN